MKLFGPMYEQHPAMGATAATRPGCWRSLSFIEAIFFPIPPEVMLAPMALAHPRRWFRYGAIRGGDLGARRRDRLCAGLFRDRGGAAVDRAGGLPGPLTRRCRTSSRGTASGSCSWRRFTPDPVQGVHRGGWRRGDAAAAFRGGLPSSAAACASCWWRAWWPGAGRASSRTCAAISRGWAGSWPPSSWAPSSG